MALVPNEVLHGVIYCQGERGINMTATAEVSELGRHFGISGVVKVTEGRGGLKRVQITGPLAQKEIYLHGARVTSWKLATQDESLFVSTKSRWDEGQTIRVEFQSNFFV